MRNRHAWILFMIVWCAARGAVWARPPPPPPADGPGAGPSGESLAQPPRGAGAESGPQQEQVISVRITSSVAVARGKKHNRIHEIKHETPATSLPSTLATKASSALTSEHHEDMEIPTIPPTLAGANIEFIKQLNAKKETRGLQHFERIHTFPSNIAHEYFNETNDSVVEPSVKSILELETEDDETGESIADIPRARSLGLSPSSKNYIQGLSHKPSGERGNNARLTTVSFNVVHDTAKPAGDPSDTFTLAPAPAPAPPPRLSSQQPQLYNHGSKYYNEPAKVYSQPAQVYSEPAKFYSEPAKIYGEPAKVYSEPAKIYSEPAKVYGEPAKFYSQPASLHLSPEPPAPPGPPNYSPWPSAPRTPPALAGSTPTNAPATTAQEPPVPSSERNAEHQPEKNYEVDEKISVLTDGRRHGVQESSTESCKQENCKVGYVVEGRQYRKYRVEERTADGFIVGEYGVVRNEDGALRGVRYTADGDTSPRLIYDALMKFLQLK